MDDINELINFSEREKYVGNVCGRYDFSFGELKSCGNFLER